MMSKDFEKDLALALGKDMCIYEDICKSVWHCLANTIWTHKSGETYSCSFRYAGGLIARIIRRGDYMDWYCCTLEFDKTDYVKEKMKEYGWTISSA